MKPKRPKNVKQHICKHDLGFSLWKVNNLYRFWCNRNCGFELNFNPDKYPDGIAIKEHVPSAEDKKITMSSEQRLKSW